MAQRRDTIKIKQQKFKVGKYLRFKDDWEGLVDFCQGNDLIPEVKVCGHCSQNIRIQYSKKNMDECLWR